MNSTNKRLWGLASRMHRSCIFPGALIVLLLGACGDERGTTESLANSFASQASAVVRSANLVGCGAARVRDSGRVLYLMVPRTCSPGGELQASIHWATPAGTTAYEVVFDDFDVGVSVAFAAERRVVSVHREGTWRAFPNEDSWTWRDGAGLLAKDGGLYLLGGWNSELGINSEVWFTTDVEHWDLLAPHAPWPPRHGGGWVVHGNRLYVIGGDLIDDAWSSVDGIQWRKERGQAPFGRRYTPSVASNGARIVLYGGQDWVPDPTCATGALCGAIGFNDVWATVPRDRGRQATLWTRLVEGAPWSPRGLVHGGAYFKGRFYVVGGGLKALLPGQPLAETVAESNDVWSSANAEHWVLETTDAGFAARTHFALLATPHGCYVANGSVGTQLNTSPDMFFAPDCVHFAPTVDPSPMARRHASSLAYFNGSIVVLGGHRDTAGTAVWQYFPEAARHDYE